MNERREPSLDGYPGDDRGEDHGAGTPVAARCDTLPAPPGTTVVLFGADGQARRPAPSAGKAPFAGKGETAWWFAPGPHTVALVPFAGAPELGLRLAFVIDTADPRLARQRFDLFLFSEVAGQAGSLSLADLAGRLEAALRAALAGGTLDLPPCTSLEEWQAFRAGLDELLYMRFGLTVDDCVPVELDDVDFAGVLRRRAAALALGADEPVPRSEPVAAPAAKPGAPVAGPDDAAALRRLFLELPEASRVLRLLPAPAFAARQAQLQRLALAALDVNTMPALAWAAPGRRRAFDEQRKLADASAQAVRALDELWSALAQMKVAAGGDDELDRIVANCECHLAARRGNAGGASSRSDAESRHP
ncbi:hypothetical protein [Pseudoduganella albidiflava]|uniref:Uncharacterized protein n=1 Tax=Pseudoduganella albidiflava TaxID=321983 RepID=A0A411WZE8_9BURK|nr:hypothetical protein [Pseudoduganella albidiflava]QBI02089.1 hypothetical protein EYF70_15420 [Pseudoduganella albidiflava]GGY65484.1 hypothetical protein GCM10007387_54760 [Pseudoduganella albidiflava]